MKTVFEKSRLGLSAASWVKNDIQLESDQWLDQSFLRNDLPGIAELSEIDVIRHFMALSKRNFSIDEGMYPLGSCTMKYNPRINEVVADLEGFTKIHPLQDDCDVQGTLELMYHLEKLLCDIAGMDAFSLQPAAGAHGEFLGLLLVRAYHRHHQFNKNKVLIPDSAHGTNPSSAHLTGYEVVTVKSTHQGIVDIEDLKSKVSDDVACLMLTNPNTLGLFERDILKVAELLHQHNALLYYDGANLNPLLGLIKPGQMGFDIVHINTHKTFSTPHGGGGPGAGPVGVKEHLIPFLPVPKIVFENGKYTLVKDSPLSVGRLHSFFGNVGVLIRAYAYIRTLGIEGIRHVGRSSIIHANYLLKKLEPYFDRVHQGACMHEFVLSGKKWLKYHVKVLDIAKRLLDFGVHAPTVYFPLIVDEALMIEPTETESKESMDHFIKAIEIILKEIQENPQIVQTAPHTTCVSRLDEVKAVRQPKLTDL